METKKKKIYSPIDEAMKGVINLYYSDRLIDVLCDMLDQIQKKDLILRLIESDKDSSVPPLPNTAVTNMDTGETTYKNLPEFPTPDNVIINAPYGPVVDPKGETRPPGSPVVKPHWCKLCNNTYETAAELGVHETVNH